MDVNAVSSDGTSSGLAEAARSNSVQVVEWLLGLEDTDVNIRTLRIDCDPYHCAEWMELPWWTPLMYACEAGHGDIVRMLTDHPKISMFYVDKNKWTAAHVAARCRKCVDKESKSKLERSRLDGTHTSLLSPGKWIFLCCPELLCGQRGAFYAVTTLTSK